jgi:transcriptional antiterminator RfaH
MHAQGTQELSEYPRWFAVMTRPNSERLADVRLRAQGYWTFFPFHRVRRRRRIAGTDKFRVEWVERPYFVGYVFLGLRRGEELASVNDTPGVATVVYNGPEPLEVPHNVMDNLMARADGGGFVSNIDMVEPERKRFAPGATVRFGDNSPLAGLLAQVAVDAGKEISVWLEMFGSKRQMSVSPNQVVGA